MIGEEGNGKSALLRAIACPDTLESWAIVTGQVHTGGEVIAYLPQETHAFQGSIYDFCAADPAFLSSEWQDLASACRLLRLDPSLPYEARDLHTLSGGEKVRLSLMLCMLKKPSMLLLDEPGNDLDLDAMKALETLLLESGLPALFVSHDEALLTRCATGILHLESLYGRTQPRASLHREGYAAYMQSRRETLIRQEQQYMNDRRQEQIREEKFRRIEQAVASAQEKISRQDPHGGRLLKKKMKSVKSLEHRYAREKKDLTQRPYEEYAIHLTWNPHPPLPAGKEAVSVSLPLLQAGSRVLARNIALHMRGNEKVLLIGPNGCGKTTLLHWILAHPDTTHALRVGCMHQQYTETLKDSLSPLVFLCPNGDKETLTRVRLTLGSLKMTREETMHPLSDLSGGQRAKVLLLSLVLQDPDLLVLDEPTRNLSPLSAPMIRDLILQFPGPILCTTHDRTLMHMWPGRILRLTEEGLVSAEVAIP